MRSSGGTQAVKEFFATKKQTDESPKSGRTHPSMDTPKAAGGRFVSTLTFLNNKKTSGSRNRHDEELVSEQEQAEVFKNVPQL